MISIPAASVVLLAGTALADSLTIITPCAGCPSSVSLPPITVSSQYQTVSTCAPTTSCAKGGLCQTNYPFETYAYVSTVIPAADSSTTITKTDQPVTVSKFRTTITNFYTPAERRHAKPTLVYSTIGQDYVLPYNEIGPLAIPGYGGSGLCTDCGEDDNGARLQRLAVTECTAGPAGTKCVEYKQTLLSTSAPSAVSKTAAACSTSLNAPSAGTYTFTFSHSAPARTITANGNPFTVGGQSFNVYASRFVGHAGPFHFQTTVTATVTQTVPASTLPATATHAAPVPPAWIHKPSGTYSTASSSSDPNWPAKSSSSSSPADSSWPMKSPSSSSSADPSSWLEWTSSSSSPSSPSPTWTSTTSAPFSTPTTTTPPVYPTSHSTTTLSTPSTHSTTPVLPTTTSTTTTSSSPTPSLNNLPPTVTPIHIIVALANARYHKRAISYISFSSGGDAILVSDISSASTFDFYQGYLIDTSNGGYIGTDAHSGTPALEEFSDAASASNNWSSVGGALTFGDVSFCYSADLEVLMVFPGAVNPAGCVTCVLGEVAASSTTTTTISTSTKTTTTSTAPQNSATLSERELESQEKEEVEQPEVIDKRAVKRRHGLLHKH